MVLYFYYEYLHFYLCLIFASFFLFSTHPLQVNLFFLLNVIRVLITKLRKTHCAESTAYMKAVRATLILIPLLGVQYILVPWIPDGYYNQAIYFFVSIFSNFQVCTCAKVIKTMWTFLYFKTLVSFGWDFTVPMKRIYPFGCLNNFHPFLIKLHWHNEAFLLKMYQ